MGDMLIRGINAELKQRLEESARRNRRSLSEEAIMLIQRGIATEAPESRRPGDRLRSILGNAQFTDEEIAAIVASRSEPDRSPPDLN